MSLDELRTLRNRLDSLETTLDQKVEAGGASYPSMIGVTFAKSSYPTTASCFYAVHPVVLSGAQGEGVVPTSTTNTGVTVYAENLGTAIPPVGTKAVCRYVGRRWCFKYSC